MKYYIISGEASGDLHASNLAKALRRQDAEACFRAWGGERLQAAGAEVVKHYKDLSFMGFVEVVTHLGVIFSLLDFCIRDIVAYRPDAVILVDYPGFNLRVAKRLYRKGIPVFYYISPQVWAWKKSRLRQIRKYVDEMYVILPFEEDFYARHGMRAHYLGHPLLDELSRYTPDAHFREMELCDGQRIIALLPGSRTQEIRRMLPVMAEVAERHPEYRFVIAGVKHHEALYLPYLSENVRVVYGRTYDLLSQSAAALVTSGTATLETALFGVPQVVCYRANGLSYQIAKHLVKGISYISLVNLIAGKKVVTELIQREMNADAIDRELQPLLQEGEPLSRMQADYREVRRRLGDGKASEAIAASMRTALEKKAEDKKAEKACPSGRKAFGKRMLFLALLLVTMGAAQAINIKVRVLSEFNVKSVAFHVMAGQYMLLCDNARIFEEDLKAGESVTISVYDGQIRVEKGIELLGAYAQVDFIGTRYSNVFSLQSPQAGKKRTYEERLSASVQHGMLLINRVDLEKYVAGVVQSEVFGSSNDVEFFKIQATAARTYCLANLNRHLKEGYNMCDAVHCQSYKGKCTEADILRGTFETYGDVIVDSSYHLITPAYHSNSGGMTVDAGDIWQRSVPYLQARVDSFSMNARNYLWEKRISSEQWTSFFVSKYGPSYRNSDKQQKIRNLSQPQRMAYWVVDRDTIPTKLLRNHFKLRSSYFSVHLQEGGDSVCLSGKGYGHGVGLSQEGAIQMVRSGYGFQEILQFYYQNVQIVKYADIINF